MKKIAVMLSLLLMIGAVPGWCLIGTVDNYVDGHTKDSSFRPVQDTGHLYGTVNDGIGKGLDKVPVINKRSVVMDPLDKGIGETIGMTKKIINGTWDILTFKSMRDKK